MDSPTEFDPYVEWLEIDPALSPPNYYDLLSVDPFESDYQKIEKAYEVTLAKIRSYQTGPRGKYTQEILNELTRARICLTDPDTKREYDDSLRLGAAKPPISVANIVAGELPPIQENAIRISNKDDDSPQKKPLSSVAKSKRLSMIYASGCLIALFAIWGIAKLVRGDSKSKKVVAEETNDSAEEKQQKKKEPKKIVNLIEEKKGILPGANNSFLLNPGNAKVDTPNPVVIDTSDGQLFDKWKTAKDSVRWEIWINTPGYYEAIVRYTATSNDPYSKLIVKKGNDFTKKTKMRSSEELGDFFEEEFVLLFREEGENVVHFSVEGDAGDFRLQSITVRPNRTTRE